ncbi:MAG: hypothetical protein KKA65_02150 [Nanoarchaeota archaeon]|nr:hypothetical protein [Nanoarchaeota archaeon]MBU4241901.1 hypothetical protein [Nanoarchaeota archaeon]MBU4352517.1 hypothetical protein [Nanoarchaeota archaeon]MBU4456278.1 hypothetical protein [Nanoarchaeota archaeon]MCG2720261.1 hypothetical protein [Nanoarchaeota archaeon]
MEPVFKYIFALIVGIMFIIFFIGFAYNYIGTEENKMSLLLTKSFDDQLNILSIAQDSVMNYDFGAETALSFNQGALRSGSQNSRKTDNIVYSPVNLKGKELIIWTKKWDMPYAVTNFFYMTNKNYKYVLIYDRTSKDFVDLISDPKEEIPEVFKVVTYDADKLREQFNDVRSSYSSFTKVKFIYFSEQPSNSLVNSLENINNAEVISIIPGDDSWQFGTIDFQADKEAMYIGQPMLLGAIFVDDYSNYLFNLEKKALPKLKEITEVYINKASFMSSALQCQEYGLINTQLQYLYNLNEESEPEEFVKTANNLENINKEHFGSECPGVF